MTTLRVVVIFSNMDAEAIINERIVYSETAFSEIVVWKLPQRLAGSTHDYKYRLAYVVDDVCVLRFDNEAGAITSTMDRPKIAISSFQLTCCLPISRNIFKGGIMKTVILSVRSHDEAMADVRKAWKSGVSQRAARISFATPELLWKVLTAKRWELLKALCGTGPVTFRKAAELVDRDVKAVHADLTALIKAGVVKREAEGVVFPYETIKVDFELKATG